MCTHLHLATPRGGARPCAGARRNTWVTWRRQQRRHPRSKWHATSRRGREADCPAQHRTTYTCRQLRSGRRGVTSSIVAHVAVGRHHRTTQHHQSCLPQPVSRHKHPRHHVNSNNKRQTLCALHRGGNRPWQGGEQRAQDTSTCSSHTGTDNGHGRCRMRHQQRHISCLSQNRTPQHISAGTHSETRAHTPPQHDTTPQGTRTLTTAGAAAGAGVGTAGAGCITSHDIRRVSNPPRMHASPAADHISRHDSGTSAAHDSPSQPSRHQRLPSPVLPVAERGGEATIHRRRRHTRRHHQRQQR
jgi:hypothetical protein